jgi:cytochrome d ubiquinol oxidase subunit I
MESHWQTMPNAPIHLIVWPDVKNQKNYFEYLTIPSALSILAFKDPSSEVVGLADIPAADRPPVALPFVNFRLMVAIGMAMTLLVLWSWRRIKKLDDSAAMLKILVWFIPLPYIACNAGWVVTEVGRQPWLVHNVMRTADGVSEGLAASQVAFSLIALTVVLTLLTVIAFGLIVHHARKGPDAVQV